MTKYVIRRVIQAIPVLFGITIVVYMILLAAPGGPTAKFSQNPRMTQEQRDAFIHAWGLDQPAPVQYCRWLGACNPDVSDTIANFLPAPAAFIGPTGWPNFLPTAISGAENGLFHGDFGYSISTGEDVSKMIARAALPTFILAGDLARGLAHGRDLPRRDVGDQALLVLRPGHDDLLLRRIRDPDLLARDHAHHDLQRDRPEHPASQRHDRDARVAAVRE